MRVNLLESPSTFVFDVYGRHVEQKDYGTIYLEPYELVSFITKSGKHHDVVGEEWGFWATQSVNRRMVDNGFKVALTKNSQGKYFVAVVDTDKEEEFNKYLEYYGCCICFWISDIG